jgi:hypothetical protein
MRSERGLAWEWVGCFNLFWKFDPVGMFCFAIVLVGEHAFQPMRLMLGDNETFRPV